MQGIKDEIVFYSRKYMGEEPSSGVPLFSGPVDVQSRVINLRMRLDSIRNEIGRYSVAYSINKSQLRKSDPDGVIKSLRDDEASSSISVLIL